MRLQPGMAAWVTGAGSGIGRGLTLELAARGLKVAAADIRGQAAEETADLVRSAGGEAFPIAVDVSDGQSVEMAAREAEATLGPVSLVCSNAGVAMHGIPIHEIDPTDWDWVIGVNIHGVIHCIRSFLPAMLERGGRGHFLHTASIGGFQVNPNFLTAAYSMTKYAVVALSEGLRNELDGTKIGVSVLAPAAVATEIHLSARSRPDRLGGAGVREANHFLSDLIRDGSDPREIGRMAIKAIESGRFYIFPHPETKAWLQRRHDAILDDFAAALPTASGKAAAE
jgi:NAD(P)-dependent dehydrogenase (short-subunit alcohol dehydrogenase family)